MRFMDNLKVELIKTIEEFVEAYELTEEELEIEVQYIN
jgi:hypothetical protein